MEPQPPSQPEARPEPQLADEFRNVAQKTSRPNAWAETARTFGIKSGDDSVLVIMKKRADEHSVTLESRAVTELANEYDRLWKAATLSLPAEMLDHSTLVGWFLEKKGVLPKPTPEPSAPPQEAQDEARLAEVRAELEKQKLAIDIASLPEATKDELTRLFEELRIAKQSPLTETRTSDIETQIGTVLGLHEDDSVEGIKQEADKIRYVDGLTDSMRYLIRDQSVSEAVQKLFTQTSPELAQAFQQYQEAKEALKNKKPGEENYTELSNRVSTREASFWSTLKKEAKTSLVESYANRITWQRDRATESNFNNLLQREPAPSLEELTQAFIARNHGLIVALAAYAQVNQRVVNFLNETAQKAGLTFERDEYGNIDLIEKTPPETSASAEAPASIQRVATEPTSAASPVAPPPPEPPTPPETAPLPEAPALFGEGSPFVTIRGEGWEEDEKLSEEMKESLEQQRKKDRSGITGEVEFVEYQEKGRSPAGLGRWIPTRSDLAADFANMPIGQWIREPQPDSQLAIKVARGDPQAEGQLAAERWALFNLQTLFEDDDPARPPRILGFGMASVESLERKPRAYLILEKIGPPFENLEDYLKKTGGKLPEKEVLEIAIGLAHILMKAHQRGIMNNDTNDLKLRDSFWDPIGKRLRQIDWGNASNQNVDMGFVQKRSYYHDREGFTRLLLGLLTGDMVSVDAKRITPPPEISQTTREIIERVYLKPNYGPHSSPEGTAQMYIDLMIAYRQLTGQPIDTARYYQQRLDEQLTRLTLINSYDSVKQNPPTDPALQKIWKEIDFNVRAAENDRMAIEKYGSAIAYVLANTKNGYWSLFDTALNTIYASPTEVNVATLAPAPAPEAPPVDPERLAGAARIDEEMTRLIQEEGLTPEQARERLRQLGEG